MPLLSAEIERIASETVVMPCFEIWSADRVWTSPVSLVARLKMLPVTTTSWTADGAWLAGAAPAPSYSSRSMRPSAEAGAEAGAGAGAGALVAMGACWSASSAKA